MDVYLQNSHVKYGIANGVDTAIMKYHISVSLITIW